MSKETAVGMVLLYVDDGVAYLEGEDGCELEVQSIFEAEGGASFDLSSASDIFLDPMMNGLALVARNETHAVYVNMSLDDDGELDIDDWYVMTIAEKVPLLH